MEIVLFFILAHRRQVSKSSNLKGRKNITEEEKNRTEMSPHD